VFQCTMAGDEAQTRGAETLIFEGTIADLALAMEENGAPQGITGLALVQPRMAALA
jgi:hypothetical protein